MTRTGMTAVFIKPVQLFPQELLVASVDRSSGACL